MAAAAAAGGMEAAAADGAVVEAVPAALADAAAVGIAVAVEDTVAAAVTGAAAAATGAAAAATGAVAEVTDAMAAAAAVGMVAAAEEAATATRAATRTDRAPARAPRPNLPNSRRAHGLTVAQFRTFRTPSDFAFISVRWQLNAAQILACRGANKLIETTTLYYTTIALPSPLPQMPYLRRPRRGRGAAVARLRARTACSS